MSDNFAFSRWIGPPPSPAAVEQAKKDAVMKERRRCAALAEYAAERNRGTGAGRVFKLLALKITRGDEPAE